MLDTHAKMHTDLTVPNFICMIWLEIVDGYMYVYIDAVLTLSDVEYMYTYDMTQNLWWFI